MAGSEVGRVKCVGLNLVAPPTHLAGPPPTHILLPSHPQLSSTQGVTPDEWQIALATFFLLGRSVKDVIILP